MSSYPRLKDITTVVLISVVWFFVCATLWAQIFPIENIYSLARMLCIYGDENIYDLAAALGITIPSAVSLVLTWLSVVFLRRHASYLTSPHPLQNKHRRDQHGDDA